MDDQKYPDFPVGKSTFSREAFARAAEAYFRTPTPLTCAPKGWVCPKCGNVYSPDVPVCMDCNSERMQPMSRAERRRKRPSAQGGGR